MAEGHPYGITVLYTPEKTQAVFEYGRLPPMAVGYALTSRRPKPRGHPWTERSPPKDLDARAKPGDVGAGSAPQSHSKHPDHDLWLQRQLSELYR